MRENIKAVFIDIDGTLHSGNAEAFDYNISVIKKVRALGHKVFINTGRALANIPCKIDIFKDFDGAVMANGAHLVIDGKTVFVEYMENELLVKIFEKLKTVASTIVLEGDKKVLGYVGNGTVFPDYVKKFENVDELKMNLEKVKYHKAVYWGVLPDKMIIEGISPDLRVLQLKNYGEILTKNTDKVNGIKRIIKNLGIDKKDTIAMGDSLNDYDAMMFAGYSVAMKNSQSEILEIADFIGETSENGGVGKALERIFFKKF